MCLDLEILCFALFELFAICCVNGVGLGFTGVFFGVKTRFWSRKDFLTGVLDPTDDYKMYKVELGLIINKNYHVETNHALETLRN